MRNRNTRDLELEKTLFVTGWCLFALALFAVAVYYYFFGRKGITLIRCPFYFATGLYCPGCGGTRAVLALIKGHIVQSFIFHPFVIYSLALGLVFLVSQTIGRIYAKTTGNVEKGMKIAIPFHSSWLWMGLGIAVFNFILKIVLKISFGIDLIELAQDKIPF